MWQCILNDITQRYRLIQRHLLGFLLRRNLIEEISINCSTIIFKQYLVGFTFE